VSIDLTDVVNVQLDDQVTFTGTSVTLFIDDLGILNDSDPLGTVTLNFTVREFQGPGPTAVPEPGTLALFGSAAAVAYIRRRRAAGGQARPA
jgi:hypothetical protein